MLKVKDIVTGSSEPSFPYEEIQEQIDEAAAEIVDQPITEIVDNTELESDQEPAIEIEIPAEPVEIEEPVDNEVVVAIIEEAFENEEENNDNLNKSNNQEEKNSDIDDTNDTSDTVDTISK